MAAISRTKARAIQKAFGKRYGRAQNGTIEGGDGSLVMLNGHTLSFNVLRPQDFGCPDGVLALLVRYTDPDRAYTGAPATFPKKFRGLPVYYTRTGRVVAL